MADFSEEIEQFLASFSPDEVAVMRQAFRAILEGRPATVARLPAAVGLAPAVVEAAVGHLTERGVVVIEPETGEITGARGLSLTETAHRLFLEGRTRLRLLCGGRRRHPCRARGHSHHRVPLPPLPGSTPVDSQGRSGRRRS